MNGEITYFRTECLAFSDRVLVELVDISGTSFLYSSAVEMNPGPLTSNTVSNETLGTNRRTVAVQISVQRQVKDIMKSAFWVIKIVGTLFQVVYVGVQGQGTADSFLLIVWDQLFVPSESFIGVLVDNVQPGDTIYDVQLNLTAAAIKNQHV